MDKINKLSAILVTEIVNVDDKPQTNATLNTDVNSHTSLFNTLIKHNGQLLQEIGDSNIVIFEHPSDAVNCALELNEINVDPNITVTSALHLGDIKAVSNDIFGNSVNIALSILQTTEPNRIFISEMFFGAICYNKAYSTKLIGLKKLKGLQYSTTLFEVCDKETTITNETESISNIEKTNKKKKSKVNLEVFVLISLAFVFVFLYQTYDTYNKGKKDNTYSRIEILPSNATLITPITSAVTSIVINNIKEQNQLAVLVRENNLFQTSQLEGSNNDSPLFNLTIEVKEINRQLLIQLTLFEPDNTNPTYVANVETSFTDLTNKLNSALLKLYQSIDINRTSELTHQFDQLNLTLIGTYVTANQASNKTVDHSPPLQSNVIDVQVKLQYCLFLAKRFRNKEIGPTFNANNCAFKQPQGFSIHEKMSLATFYYLTKNTSDSYKLVNDILAINPVNYDALLLKAKLAISLQDVQEAETLLTMLSKMFSANKEVLQMQALLNIKNGNQTEAQQLIEKAVSLSTDRAEDIILFTLDYQNKGLLTDAVSLVERYIKQLNSSRLHFRLAQLLFLQSKLEDSKQAILKALKLAPKNANYHYLLGEIYFFLDERNNAAFHYNAAIDNFTKTTSIIQPIENAKLALSYARINKPFKAEDTIEQAIRQANNDATVNYFASMVFHHMNKKESATVYLSQAKKLGLNTEAIQMSPRWTFLNK